MITVAQAESLISQHTPSFSVERCPLHQAHGKILRENIQAERDQPPFHRVAMDGISICFGDWQNGATSFAIEATHHAGQEAPILQNKNGCFEVTTGSVLPQKTDCVIRFEDLRIENNRAYLAPNLQLKKMQNVHQMSSDHKQGAVLVKEGTLLLAPDMAIAASEGKKELLVAAFPKVAVISTGDELVDVGDAVKPYQIRRSNPYAIQSELKRRGYSQVEMFHFLDEKDAIYHQLGQILNTFSILVLSGGVSMGKFDFIPQVLKELEVEKIFHKVSQRPGKPLWFGTRKDKAVFALPGNPVSSLVCFYRYVLPQLSVSCGFLGRKSTFLAALSEKVYFKPKLTYFLPVTVASNEEGKLIATPVPTNGSGDYGSLSKTDGFVELEADCNQFSKGHITQFYHWGF